MTPTCYCCRRPTVSDEREMCSNCREQIGALHGSPWLPLTDETIVLVAGLGRCGTSLVMQMLDAGGFPVAGEFPDYEFEEQMALPFNKHIWLPIALGRAVKALDPFRWPPPLGIDARCIFLVRNHREQMASQARFVGGAAGRAQRRSGAKLLAKQEQTSLKQLSDVAIGGVLKIAFETLITDPRRAAATLSFMLGGLDVDRMVRQVRPRQPKALAWPLEPALVEAGTLLP